MSVNVVRCLCFVLAFCATPIWADAPTLIPVQGALNSSDGTPVSDVFAVTFTLYADDAGATQLWTEQSSVNFVEGAFTAYLGSSTALDLAIFRDNGTVYLGIQISDDEEMPLLQLASSPFAGFAQYAGFAADITDAAKIQIVGDVAVQLDNDGKVHDKYTDAEAIAAVTNALSTDTTQLEAALGAEGDANPLNHTRYTDAEAVAALASHTGDAAAHHAPYTHADALAAVASADAYVSNTGDTIDGNLVVTNGTISGELASGSGPAGGRICPRNHYLSMGYCMPKGTYTDKTTCSGGALNNGVCWSWANGSTGGGGCSWRTLPDAATACTGLGGRLCTVAELDRLDGTGCGQDSTIGWANLSVTYNDGAMFGLCIRAQDGVVSTGGGTPDEANDEDNIAGCTAIHYNGPSVASSYTGYTMCCYD